MSCLNCGEPGHLACARYPLPPTDRRPEWIDHWPDPRKPKRTLRFWEYPLVLFLVLASVVVGLAIGLLLLGVLT
jgi:hypothetical protein